MHNNYLIYKYTSPSGKSYIGQTKNIERRSREHRYAKSGCALFAKAVCKYGYENFTLDILDSNPTLDEANTLEEYYINELHSLAPNGYNLRTGGKNHTLTDIGRKNLSEAHKGILQSEESRKKRSESTKGMKRTKETKEKISAANMGKVRSEESKKKISIAHTGKKIIRRH